MLVAIGVLAVLVSNHFSGGGTKKEPPPIENNDVANVGETSKRAKEVSKKVEPPKAGPDRKAVEMLHPYIELWVRSASGREMLIRKTDPIPDGSFVVSRIEFSRSILTAPADFQTRILLPAVLPLGSLQSFEPGAWRPSRLSGDDLANLAKAPFAPELRSLNAFEITPDTIDSLKRFPQLARLVCRANNADDAALARLKELSTLKKLDLSNLGDSGKVSQKGYESLTALPLTTLYLRSRVTAEALRRLAGMRELTELGVVEGNASDELLPEIARFSRLEFLDLSSNPKVTDIGLAHLASMKSLRTLLFWGPSAANKVTKTGAETLSDALPKCQIALPDGVKIGPKDKSVTPPLSVDPGDDFVGAGQPALLQSPFTKEQAEKARAEWAAFLKIPERQQFELLKGVKFEVVLIPPGLFRMGKQGDTPDEVPHDVMISKPFYMAVSETTQEQYETIMGVNPSKFKGEKNPVETVSWNDAQGFMTKMTENLRDKKAICRLPSEAEWEYACRAGTTTDFCFGTTITSSQANFTTNDYNMFMTKPVASYEANAFGLYDVHGNVAEWCQDYFGPYSGAPTDGTAQMTRQPTVGAFSRIHRGGVFKWYCSSSKRISKDPTWSDYTLGFRVVVTQK